MPREHPEDNLKLRLLVFGCLNVYSFYNKVLLTYASEHQKGLLQMEFLMRCAARSSVSTNVDAPLAPKSKLADDNNALHLGGVNAYLSAAYT